MFDEALECIRVKNEVRVMKEIYILTNIETYNCVFSSLKQIRFGSFMDNGVEC